MLSPRNPGLQPEIERNHLHMSSSPIIIIRDENQSMTNLLFYIELSKVEYISSTPNSFIAACSINMRVQTRMPSRAPTSRFTVGDRIRELENSRITPSPARFFSVKSLLFPSDLESFCSTIGRVLSKPKPHIFSFAEALTFVSWSAQGGVESAAMQESDHACHSLSLPVFFSNCKRNGTDSQFR